MTGIGRLDWRLGGSRVEQGFLGGGGIICIVMGFANFFLTPGLGKGIIPRRVITASDGC